jgi:hypothetical protein
MKLQQHDIHVIHFFKKYDQHLTRLPKSGHRSVTAPSRFASNSAHEGNVHARLLVGRTLLSDRGTVVAPGHQFLLDRFRRPAGL